jgi:hypothetical protein
VAEADRYSITHGTGDGSSRGDRPAGVFHHNGVPLMMRFALAAALGFAAINFGGFTTVTADDKDEKKTLEGTLTCTKCALNETKACGNALIVKEGDKKVTYYLTDKGGKETYHKDCCQADVEAKVTGKIGEKDGKKTIEDPKVEVKK